MDKDLYGITVALCRAVREIEFESLEGIEMYSEERGGPALTPETRGVLTDLLGREAFARLVRTPSKRHTRSMFEAALAGIAASPYSILQLKMLTDALMLTLVSHLPDDQPGEIEAIAIVKR